MTEEVTYYSDDEGVKITNREAVFSKKSYEIGTIISIRVTKNPSSSTIPLILIGCGSFFLIISIIRFRFIEFFIGVFSLIFGIYDLVARPMHMIKLLQAKGEYVPFSSRDKDRVEQIVDALEAAIATRRKLEHSN